MSKSKLVIVESPSKAKTISKILGDEFKVIASNGHIKDLPKSKLGVDEDLNPSYVLDKSKSKIVNEIKRLAKDSDTYLAADNDREGEAISYHIANILKLSGKVRITFNEITANAVIDAVQNPRELDENKFNAQQTRRILDRLVGYGISPLLWKKLGYGTSAGRVQSVALMIICELEDTIKKFKPEPFWDVDGNFNGITLPLHKYKEEKIDKLTDKSLLDKIENLKGEEFNIASSKTSKKEGAPPVPFKTSSLQQAASSELGFSPSRTMKIAQTLYSGIDINKKTLGLITYMRTDSVRVADEAIKSAKYHIEKRFGKDYTRGFVNKKTKSKIQDAHEAIRPTYIDKEPESIKGYLTNDQFKLYNLIYNRFLASQMANMKYEQLELSLERDGFYFRELFNRKIFDGYTKIYPSSLNFEIFPKIEDKYTLADLEIEEKETKPPARLSEASLIKKLEADGIGRPSTYATIVETLKSREYVKLDSKKFIPTNLGFAVTDELKDSFSDILNTKFTANMEENLDDIESGKKKWKQVLKSFNKELQKDIEKYKDKSSEKAEVSTDTKCSECSEKMLLKRGRFGPYLECENKHKVSLKGIEIDYHDEKEGFVKIDSSVKKNSKKRAGIPTDVTIEGEEALLKEGPYGKYLEAEVNGEKIRESIPKTIVIKEEDLLKDKIYIKDRLDEIKSEIYRIEKGATPCEKCGSAMKAKRGRWGLFLSCSNYPKCKNIRKIKK